LLSSPSFKKGVLSKAEAETILRKAIAAVKTESAGEQAAELLGGILEILSACSTQVGATHERVSSTAVVA